MEDLVRRVKYSVGYPVVTVELPDEEIRKIIQDSMKELNKYSNEISAKTVSIESGNSIDLKNHKEIYRVLKVLEESNNKGKADEVIGEVVSYPRLGTRSVSISPGTACSHMFDTGQMMILYRTLGQFRSSLQKDLDFSEYGSCIYIPDKTGLVTLVYIVKWNPDDVDSISDDMKNLIIRHASNNLKMLLGKARKRYTSNKAVFELDTDIYSEGESDQKDLMEELKSLEISLAESI